MAIKTIFLDRDGVINREINYLHKQDEFEFIDDIFSVCHLFKKLQYEIIIITNQSGIARGFYKESEYQNLTKWMIDQFNKQGIDILDIFHCPHGPESNCSCRKPKPGMLFAAKSKYNIDMTQSWMIGDKDSDISAANSAGIHQTIMLKSIHNDKNYDSSASYYINSLKEIKKIVTS